MTAKITKGPSLKEQVYHHLKKAIISGDIEENKVYSEQWAADLLGVSRTPVREAVLQLKQEFFIDILPYKGFQVRSLTTDDIKETFQIRLALEGFCIITIAQNSQDVHVQRMLSCLGGVLLEQERLATEGKVYEFMERDEMYHRSIINHTGNERLIATYNDIRSRFELITVKVLNDPGRMEATVQEHFAILEKMRTGCPWEAYQAIQIHLDATQRVLKRQTANEVHSRALLPV